MRLFVYMFTILFPILRVAGFPFPLILLIIPFVRFDKFDRVYFFSGLCSSIYLFLILVINNLNDLSFTSLGYSVFSIFYLLLITVFLRVKNLIEIIRIYFYLNIIITIITGVLNYIPGILEFYYNYYLFGNVTSADHYMSFITNRSIGLLGHPAWLGLMVYLLGKVLSLYENKYRYVVISLVGIIMSGGRAALISLIVIEGVMVIYHNKGRVVRQINRSFLAVSFAVVAVGLMYYFNEGFSYFIRVTLEDIVNGDSFRSSSIQYRAEMFSVLFDQNFISLLFGNGQLYASIAVNAVDSELVMRVSQFGLIGFILLYMPLFIVYYKAHYKNVRMAKEISVFLILFALLGSLTTTIISNMIFMIFIAIIIALVENELLVLNSK